ncbi:hypothetical protein HPB47_013960 [Ixodes persulcatus]|uniref:Uncharacterized protein n=1 Tax=Ixodes persulcatus TaxID=34615 RepID=A0AC60QX55_IXOPE|nr:hypothetical protein HPB47_013960 [Ixodes persulcatus]
MYVPHVRDNTFGSLVRNPPTTVGGFISPRLPTLNVHCVSKPVIINNFPASRHSSRPDETSTPASPGDFLDFSRGDCHLVSSQDTHIRMAKVNANFGLARAAMDPSAFYRRQSVSVRRIPSESEDSELSGDDDPEYVPAGHVLDSDTESEPETLDSDAISSFGHSTASTSCQRATQGSCAEHKHLRGGVFFVESLPRTETGKVQRKALVERAGH